VIEETLCTGDGKGGGAMPGVGGKGLDKGVRMCFECAFSKKPGHFGAQFVAHLAEGWDKQVMEGMEGVTSASIGTTIGGLGG